MDQSPAWVLLSCQWSGLRSGTSPLYESRPSQLGGPHWPQCSSCSHCFTARSLLS